jgi:hypothetical protein
MERLPRLARRADDRPQVLLRLYVSGRSAYTQAVVANLRTTSSRYDPDEVIVQIRDAVDAEEDERVFFTPMLIVLDGREPDHRTVVVGDLREESVLNSLLSGHGVAPRH